MAWVDSPSMNGAHRLHLRGRLSDASAPNIEHCIIANDVTLREHRIERCKRCIAHRSNTMFRNLTDPAKAAIYYARALSLGFGTLLQ